MRANTAKKIKTGYKLGLYIRASTEEQSLSKNPEGTIKNQEMRLRDMARVKGLGSDITLFIDEGISAKNTKRPELQRMLRAIRAGEINMVMVTEYSRLSRNMRDFAQMWEMFKDEGCGIISIREQFDTSTAAGEMMLYNMANLAQFERRLTGERVKASRADRAARGLFNGGMVPLGYKPTGKPGFIEIDESEKEIIKMAYRAFLKEGSLAKAARWLNENGYRPPKRMKSSSSVTRVGHFIVKSLHRVLTNKIYIGKVVYKKEGIEHEAKAVWKPIIDKATFSKAQNILKKNHRKNKPAKASKYPYHLSGIVHCARCGKTLCGRSAHGKTKKIPYYEHSWSITKNSTLKDKVRACSMHQRVPGKKLEEFVDGHILSLLTRDEVMRVVVEKASKVHKEEHSVAAMIKKLRNKISKLKSQMESVTERIASLPMDVPAETFYAHLKTLSGKRKEAQSELEALERNKGAGIDKPVSLENYKMYMGRVLELWKNNGLEPDLKKRIIKLIIDKIEVDTDKVTIHYFVGKNRIHRESVKGSLLFLYEDKIRKIKYDENTENGLNEVENKGGLNNHLSLASKSSSTLTFGGERGIRTLVTLLT